MISTPPSRCAVAMHPMYGYGYSAGEAGGLLLHRTAAFIVGDGAVAAIIIYCSLL